MTKRTCSKVLMCGIWLLVMVSGILLCGLGYRLFCIDHLLSAFAVAAVGAYFLGSNIETLWDFLSDLNDVLYELLERRR
jgi:hypothetical protein